jgi:hypothetical protein
MPRSAKRESLLHLPSATLAFAMPHDQKDSPEDPIFNVTISGRTVQCRLTSLARANGLDFGRLELLLQPDLIVGNVMRVSVGTMFTEVLLN